jgi:hypothetical protein
MIFLIGVILMIVGIAIAFSGIFGSNFKLMIVGYAITFAGGVMCLTRLVEVLI